ncbi:CLN2 G1/S-specific cyclin CLN2 [Candida maltosa Xu316]|uniref:G1/S-specific cyclin n=1 Tax=Candida maltosa (strain Xu316) TaxID=1245528 RepID=M3JVG9_CANMX|nr:G1/S-specific cyclin CLN2 [Candida maltosa Xu316]
MIQNSPDAFHQVRMLQSSVKASNFKLQSMEFKCHSTNVCEYQMEMLHHLLSVETKTLPSLPLIEQQPEIKLGMRPLLLDFLMEVITILNLSRSTFPLTVNLIDRYCSTRIVKKQHYQLLGLTSLWISCKNLDSKFKVPTLNDLRKICVDSYYKELFVEMEKHILKSLEWVVNAPTFDAFIDLYLNLLISNSNNPDVSNSIKKSSHKLKLFSNYIGELFQFYPNIYYDYTSSQIALISILISILTLKIPVDLISLLNFYNGLVKTKMFKLNVNGPDDDFDEILSVESFYSLFNKSFFKNLIKIIDNPPSSLKIKYFADNGKYSVLMKQLVAGATDTLRSMLDPPPSTPKLTTIKRPIPIDTSMIPLTPVSNSTSPTRFSPDQIFSESESTTSLATTFGSLTPGSSITTPGEKRSYDCIDELEIGTSTIANYTSGIHDSLKRSKSTSRGPVFYLPQ